MYVGSGVVVGKIKCRREEGGNLNEEGGVMRENGLRGIGKIFQK